MTISRKMKMVKLQCPNAFSSPPEEINFSTEWRRCGKGHYNNKDSIEWKCFAINSFYCKCELVRHFVKKTTFRGEVTIAIVWVWIIFHFSFPALPIAVYLSVHTQHWANTSHSSARKMDSHKSQQIFFVCRCYLCTLLLLLPSIF